MGMNSSPLKTLTGEAKFCSKVGYFLKEKVFFVCPGENIFILVLVSINLDDVDINVSLSETNCFVGDVCFDLIFLAASSLSLSCADFLHWVST